MVNFNPVTGRPRVLGQQAAAPAPVVVQTPSQTAPIVNLLGWSVLGFGAGAATGYAVGKGLGHKNNVLTDGLIGGMAGVVASLVSRLL